MLKNIVVLCITIVSAKAERPYDEPWHGRFFPHSPLESSDPNPVVGDNSKGLYDPHHGIPMGVVDKSCDNAKINLQVDWYNNTENYTCFEDKELYKPKATVHPIHTVDHIPYGYSATHKCMNHSISYSHPIPTYGTHRPLWAKYGTYTFCPKQRWLHNLEHGGLVMCYHPCADKNEVEKLKKIVISCLYRHLITPCNMLSSERSLAMVTWGHRIEFSKVDMDVVVGFIRSHALKGPEHTSKNGQYDWMIEEHSQIPEGSDKYDRHLCPKYDSVKGIEIN